MHGSYLVVVNSQLTVMADFANVSSFRLRATQTGYTLAFQCNGKERRVIFSRHTRPYNVMREHEAVVRDLCERDQDHRIVEFVKYIRSLGYMFVSNKNNPSVFYPKARKSKPAQV